MKVSKFNGISVSVNLVDHRPETFWHSKKLVKIVALPNVSVKSQSVHTCVLYWPIFIG